MIELPPVDYLVLYCRLVFKRHWREKYGKSNERS